MDDEYPFLNLEQLQDLNGDIQYDMQRQGRDRRRENHEADVRERENFGTVAGNGAIAGLHATAIGNKAVANDNSIAIGANVISQTDEIVIGQTGSYVFIGGVNMQQMHDDLDFLKTENKILRDLVEAMWYAPGMPGANSIKDEIDSDLLNDEIKKYLEH